MSICTIVVCFVLTNLVVYDWLELTVNKHLESLAMKMTWSALFKRFWWLCYTANLVAVTWSCHRKRLSLPDLSLFVARNCWCCCLPWWWSAWERRDAAFSRRRGWGAESRSSRHPLLRVKCCLGLPPDSPRWAHFCLKYENLKPFLFKTVLNTGLFSTRCLFHSSFWL